MIFCNYSSLQLCCKMKWTIDWLIDWLIKSNSAASKCINFQLESFFCMKVDHLLMMFGFGHYFLPFLHFKPSSLIPARCIWISKTFTAADVITVSFLCWNLCGAFRVSWKVRSIVCWTCVQSRKFFATVFSSIKMPSACEVYQLHAATPPDTVSATRVSAVQQPSG